MEFWYLVLGTIALAYSLWLYYQRREPEKDEYIIGISIDGLFTHRITLTQAMLLGEYQNYPNDSYTINLPHNINVLIMKDKQGNKNE